MIDKALLSKIRKCLALAQSANEHEAAAALAKAHALMEQHGIDDETLALAEVEEASARASRTVRPPRWESILAATVCHALSLAVFLDERGDRRFVGRGARPEIGTYAFAALFRQIKAARSHYIKTQLRRCTPARKRARADAFCEGWAGAVYRTVQQLMAEPPEDEALGRYLTASYPGLTSVSSRAATMRRASNDYWSGREHGSSVNLHVGVGAAEAPLAIAQ